MPTQLQRSFVLAGAAGALIASIALIVVALLPRPFMPMDHFSILSGITKLSETQLAGYESYLINNLTFDSLYLLGHILMWIGYGALISRESQLAGGLIGTLGILSGWLDFTENEMRWVALKTILAGAAVPPTHIANWQVIFGLSFWTLFLCALIAGIGVASLCRFGKVICSIAFAGMLVVSLEYKYGFLPAFLWLIVWHALSALFLWSRGHCISDGKT